jgi:glutaminyl-peptide cyclotransferase
MKKLYVVVSLALLVVLCVGLLGFYLSRSTFLGAPNPSPTPTVTLPSQPTVAPTKPAHLTPTPSANQPTTYTYTVVNTYPHDTSAFTEGLVFDNGILYESTGLYGASSIRRVNVSTGAILQKVNLADQYFGEGIAVVNDLVIELTWQNGIGFIYDKNNLTLKGNFSVTGEGWGLTYDGSSLIMSNGSSTLTFLDPVTFQPTRTVSVKDGATPLINLNELEYIDGDIYANIWMQQKIVIIDPQNGQVKGYINLSNIYQPHGSDDVLNGIAYDQTTGRLFVTGKNWPNLFQITVNLKT